MIPLWLLPSTRRIVVGSNYDDRWAACRHCLDVFDGSMAILVPLTPSAAETVNGVCHRLTPHSGDKRVDRNN